MKLFIMTTILLITQIASALEINSTIAISATGQLDKSVEITCHKNSTVCQEICAHESFCKIPEELCEDCSSDKSHLMKTVFTDINSIFKADIEFVSDQQMIQFFKTRKFMTIPYSVFLNPFNPEKKDYLKTEFEKLCYISVKDSTLIATLNSKNQVEDLVGVICKDAFGSVILPIQFNPSYSNESKDYWKKLNEEIGVYQEGLKLKLTTEL